MTWREEPPRRAANPEPRTTPLHVVTTRARPAGGRIRNEAATSKIAVPSQRTDSPRRAPAESPRSAPAERRRRSRASAPPKPRVRVLVTSMLIGALVSVALGVYGRLHEPTGYAVNVAGFSSAGYVKAWLASVAVAFAVLQPISAAVMYRGKRGGPRWVAFLHRWSGRIAVLVSIPVAMHCLYAFGFESGSTRVLAHSLGGCLFYGAFTTKMLSLTRRRTPKWAVPLFGGLVFTILVALWLSSALWLFGKQGVHI